MDVKKVLQRLKDNPDSVKAAEKARGLIDQSEAGESDDLKAFVATIEPPAYGTRAGKKMATDKAFVPMLKSQRQWLALDRASLRTLSEDGHLHVAQNNISKAVVNPYWGKEIPDFESLGLEPTKKYMLLRHPKELQKAAPTFNNLPLLIEHKPVSADEHPHDLVVGSTGTDARYNHPYLQNSLVVWDQHAIDAIKNGSQRQISSAYHYVPVMQRGVYEGQPYDGIMTQIRGNHCALVEDGRAGADVVVADTAFDDDLLTWERLTRALASI